MILAADLGSTNLKAALFDTEGRRLGSSSLPLPYEIRTNRCAELNPGQVGETFDAVLEQSCASAGVQKSAISRIAITSQAQTFCIVSAAGLPVSPLIGWTDERAVREAEYLQSQLGADMHVHSGFPELLAGHMLAKVLWWKNQHGLEPSDLIIPLPSFLAMRVGCPLCVDANWAAMSGLYSIPLGDWWDRALGLAGIGRDQPGTVVLPGQRIPLGPSKHFPEPGTRELVFAGNDHTAGAVGAHCETNRSVLTLGTAGVWYRRIETPAGPYSSNGIWGPFPLGGFYELRFISHACSALDWADSFLFGRVNSEQFVQKAREACGDNGGVVFDPRKWGSAAAWQGDGTLEQKALAVLEGICDALWKLADPRELLRGTEVVVLGGGSRLDFFVQMIANKFQCPILRTDQDGLQGAAALAGMKHPSEGNTQFETFLPTEPPTTKSE